MNIRKIFSFLLITILIGGFFTMAIRQYIGARYVPKYMGHFDSTRDYEPLSIVDDANGNSYTSKVPVPAGSSLDDTRYWAPTGNFSGAITQLQNRVGALENRVDSVSAHGRNFVLLADSLGFGIHGDGSGWSGDGWAVAAKRLWSDSNVYIQSTTMIPGSTGFSSDAKFIELLQRTIVPQINDLDSITDVVVLAGTNDARISADTVKTDIGQFCSYVRTTFKNAQIRIGVLGGATAKNAIEPYKECVKSGASFISDTINLFCDPSMYAADKVHLSNEGYTFYLPYVLQAVLTGNCKFEFQITKEITLESAYSISHGTPTITFDVSNVGIRARFGEPYDANKADWGATVVNTTAPISISPYIARNIDVPVVQNLNYRLQLSIPLIAYDNTRTTVPFTVVEGRASITNAGDLIYNPVNYRVAPIAEFSPNWLRMYFNSGLITPLVPWNI